jgi:hypothetical protein
VRTPSPLTPLRAISQYPDILTLVGKGFSGTLFVPDNTVSKPWQLRLCARRG